MEIKVFLSAFVLGIIVDLIWAKPLGVSGAIFLTVIFLYGVIRRFI